MLKRLLVLFLLIGIIGAVLFFPFNMNDRYTCLYHRLFYSMEPALPGRHLAHVSQAADKEPVQHQANTLIPHYLKHFAFYWWGSLLLTGICWFLFRKKKDLPPLTRNSSAEGRQ